MNLAAAARFVIAASALAALSLNFLLASRAWSAFLFIPLIATAVALPAHRRWPGATRGAILFLAATTPALLRAGWDAFDLTNGGLWLAPLLAISLVDTGFRRWSMPRAWVLSLSLWALCIAVSWPIVLLREADFSLAAMFDYQTSVTSQGLPVPVTAVWITHIAAAQMIGLLWIDGLLARYRGARERFEREIVWPIGAALLISVGVGLYQAARDPVFLNPTVFGGMGRASGLLLDGNVFGILAAMMLPALFVLTYRRPAWWRAAAIVGAVACLAAVWGSGSRTALLAAGCTLPLTMVAIWTASRSLATRLALIGAALLLLMGVGLLAWSGRVSGPIDRVRLIFDRSSAAGQSVREYLWIRDGYGPAAIRMVEEHPIPGVGIGSFHSLVLDYSRRDNPAMGLSTDNAQNWLRHVLAELGVLGSLGVLVFAVILAVSLVRPAAAGSRVESWLIASALGGVAAASVMGVPTQHAYVLIVFWVFVAWHRIVSAHAPDHTVAPASRGAWIAVFALAVVFAGLTVEAARDELRVSNRAVRFGWPYLRGFHRLESGDVKFRWTRQHAKAVIAAQPGYLKLVYFVHHDDVSTNPVHVRIDVQGRPAVDADVRDRNARTLYVPVPPNLRSVTIETAVSRPWHPPHEAVTRELGLGLAEWVFVRRPPSGAIIVQ